MKALAEELDRQCINYVWYVFTSDKDHINSPNVIFLPERLDVYKWIQDADALVQLSDTEACSYSISEALAYNKYVVITPLPYIDELSQKSEKLVILDFNLKNIKDVVEKIKSLKSQNNCSATNYGNTLVDNYNKYLAKGKSKYEELRKQMKKIKAIKKFKDMQAKTIRNIGDEFLVDGARAEQLLGLGLVELVPEVKKLEVAVKEEKKEKAVIKEKAVKKNAKK